MQKMNPVKRYSQNCMLCGSELLYSQDYRERECVYCHSKFRTNVACKNGHYVCDKCHGTSAMDIIEQYCKSTDKTNPIEMANEIMKHHKINMHGPEHHYLVPAVLISSFYNLNGEKYIKSEKLKIAKERAKKVPGGFCGFYGSCGAAVGTGIFMSIITESTPLSKEGWGLANQMTGRALIAIGKVGGPRCCKRDSFIAIKEAVIFVEEHFKLKMYDYENYDIICKFSNMNKQCLGKDCYFNIINIEK
ncbi:DUF5714 domain-containing protein [Anaerosalibacter massiliensis]|uniref:DUF5714 domain-containing protein n=1 Tax=Anaerosalibacter massiliensis TaxID=1347392 RepID=UPI0005B2C8F4|nr:DUF5714 domain-containing protein [Anaerosalibacter massiliensis]